MTRDRVENGIFNGKHRSFGGPKIAAVVPQQFSAFSWGRTDFPWIWEEPDEPMPVIRDFGTESSAQTYPGVPRQDMVVSHSNHSNCQARFKQFTFYRSISLLYLSLIYRQTDQTSPVSKRQKPTNQQPTSQPACQDSSNTATQASNTATHSDITNKHSTKSNQSNQQQPQPAPPTTAVPARPAHESAITTQTTIRRRTGKRRYSYDSCARVGS
jgi:hypothetical protein